MGYKMICVLILILWLVGVRLTANDVAINPYIGSIQPGMPQNKRNRPPRPIDRGRTIALRDSLARYKT